MQTVKPIRVVVMPGKQYYVGITEGMTIGEVAKEVNAAEDKHPIVIEMCPSLRRQIRSYGYDSDAFKCDGVLMFKAIARSSP